MTVITRRAVTSRLERAMAANPAGPPLRDDYDAPDALVAAAVLVAITDRPEPGVLLTVRHASLRTHAGQVAFPGGRIDPDDADAVAAALREAQEEIGLAPDLVEIVGTGDPYWTGSGFDITPVIGVVPPDLPLVPHEAEVAAIFEVPLAHLLAEANHFRRSAEHGGRLRHYYEINWPDQRIWGATAGMIVGLAARLKGAA